MLLLLLEFLQNSLNFKIPAVFFYYSTRMVLASLSSLLFTIFLGKPFIRKLYQWKIGDRVRSADEQCPLLGELHRDKTNTPTMGGILILFAMLASLILWMDLRSPFTLILFVTTVWVGSIGAYDDYLKLRHKNLKGLSSKKKLLLQATLSFFVATYLLWSPVNQALNHNQWFIPPIAKEEKAITKIDSEKVAALATLATHEYASRIYLPFKKEPLVQVSGFAIVGIFLLMAFVMIGSSNAVNLTDGLDGLATGTMVLASSALALIAFISNHVDLAKYLNILYIEGSGEIAIYLSACAGACLGFLWYNGYPAQVFMGDTGSLALGSILGVSAVLLKKEFLLGIIGGVFVLEALSVILQVGSYKLRNKKRIFLCSPLHHHFEYKGWHEMKVVIRFWIVGLLFAIIGIASLKFQ